MSPKSCFPFKVFLDFNRSAGLLRSRTNLPLPAQWSQHRTRPEVSTILWLFFNRTYRPSQISNNSQRLPYSQRYFSHIELLLSVLGFLIVRRSGSWGCFVHSSLFLFMATLSPTRIPLTHPSLRDLVY